MSVIPQSLGDITPGRLQDLMRSRWPEVKIRSISVDGHIHGTATKARLAIEYSEPTPAPRTLWLKAGWEPHSAMLGKVGIYACEPRVYLELLDDLPVHVPTCHGGAYDMETLEGVVLLENLDRASIRLHTPESDISPREVEQMLVMLAGMHGKSSSPEFLARHPWLEPVFEGLGREGDYKTYISDPGSLSEFLKRPRAEAYPNELRDPQDIQTAMVRLAEWAASTKHRCLLHGDAHIGNTYSEMSKPGLLDWQCVRHGGWAYDVTYYMVSALSIEDRRNAETSLLETYIDALCDSGGPRIGMDEALSDYRICLIWGFVAWLSNSTDFQPEEYNRIVSNRFAAAMVDHGTLRSIG